MSFTPPVGLAINHVGVTVPDVYAAIDWYGAVFGFRCIMGPRVLEADGHTEAAAVFGSRFRRAWQAHLLSGNSVGIELFQFIDPPTRGPRPSQERVPWLDRGCGIYASPTRTFRPWWTASSITAGRCWRRPTSSCPDGLGCWPMPPTPGVPCWS